MFGDVESADCLIVEVNYYIHRRVANLLDDIEIDGSSGIAIPVFELDLYLDASGSWKSTPAS